MYMCVLYYMSYVRDPLSTDSFGSSSVNTTEGGMGVKAYRAEPHRLTYPAPPPGCSSRRVPPFFINIRYKKQIPIKDD